MVSDADAATGMSARHASKKIAEYKRCILGADRKAYRRVRRN